MKIFEGSVNIVKNKRDERNETIIDILRLLEKRKERYDVEFNRNREKMLEVTIRNLDGSIYKRLVEEENYSLRIERYYGTNYYPEVYHWDLASMDRVLILEQI